MRHNLKDLALEAVQKWGKEPQLCQATEELAELIVAINHFRRDKADVREVAEEIADCQLILEQLKLIIGISKEGMEEVQQAKLEKLKRGLSAD